MSRRETCKESRQSFVISASGLDWTPPRHQLRPGFRSIRRDVAGIASRSSDTKQLTW